MQWVNLYALQQMDVRERSKAYGKMLYVTELRFGRYETIELDIEPGAHIGIHSDAVLKRLAECKEGA